MGNLSTSTGSKLIGPQLGATTMLPIELVEALNQAYFLHLLATDPTKVLPPGKSLISMMARPHSNTSSGTSTPDDDKGALLHDRVEQVVHRAFWNEALKTLSSPIPSIQLLCLKRLYSDLLEGLSPLLPPNHSILQTLSAPLPPTSSPLHSTLALLKEILACLRERSAPAKDGDIDTMLRNLNEPLPPPTPAPVRVVLPSDPSTKLSPSTSPSNPPPSPLAQLVVNTFRSILSLAETMKSDLNQFVLGAMTEAQLRDVIVQQAKVREREIVLDIWGDTHQSGRDRIKESWLKWTGELEVQPQQPNETRKVWILRLVQALGSTAPVSCNFPAAPLTAGELPETPEILSSPDTKSIENTLPPQFFFTTPTFLYIQNYLQVLVIAASLRSLTRLPPHPPRTTQASADGELPPGHDFMQRIWTLLKAEIDEEEHGLGTDHTKIVNLADEVTRARKLSISASTSTPLSSSTLDADEESRLRTAVERTLRPNDPVFLLLQKRLMSALAKRLSEVSSPPVSPSSYAPDRMQTGRQRPDERPGKRPRLMFETDIVGLGNPGRLWIEEGDLAKGYEDPVLTRAFGDVVDRVWQCVYWVEGVWCDSLD